MKPLAGQIPALQPSADKHTPPAQPICGLVCRRQPPCCPFTYTPPLRQPRLGAPCSLQPLQSLASLPTGPASASQRMMLAAAQGAHTRTMQLLHAVAKPLRMTPAAPGRSCPIRAELVAQGQCLPGHNPSMAPDLLLGTCRWCRCCVPSVGCCDPLGSHTHSRLQLCIEAALYKPHASQHQQNASKVLQPIYLPEG